MNCWFSTRPVPNTYLRADGLYVLPNNFWDGSSSVLLLLALTPVMIPAAATRAQRIHFALSIFVPATLHPRFADTTRRFAERDAAYRLRPFRRNIRRIAANR